MANLRLPPNVRIDPDTGYYVITNRGGKSVRVAAQTQNQLDTFVRSVNSNTPVTVTQINPTTGLEQNTVFDPAKIIADTDALAQQRASRNQLRDTTGLVGTTQPDQFQDINTGRTYTTAEAETIAQRAGLPPQTVTAARPRNQQELSRAQTALDQRVNDPSQLADPPQRYNADQPPAIPVAQAAPLQPDVPVIGQDLPDVSVISVPPALDVIETGNSTIFFEDGRVTGRVDFFGSLETEPQPVSPAADPQVLAEIQFGEAGQEIGTLTTFTPAAVSAAEDPEVGRFAEFDAAGQEIGARVNFGPATVSLTTLTDAELDAALANTPQSEPGYALLVAEYETRFGNGPNPLDIEIVGADQAAADITQSAADEARIQAVLSDQRRQANDGDWRVKLRLAAGATYLYRDPDLQTDGILYPLAVTDGVIFPYTPQITTTYNANYSPYDLTHSNYRGYFYQNSYVGEIQVQATFTAQDTSEANYLLAVIHFFKSVTKMFYGQDSQRGTPPPLVFLQGLGEFQFNLHPCAVTQFNYTLPADVDYIRARTVNINGTNLLQRRDRQTLPTNPFSAAWERLTNAGLNRGAISVPPPPPTLGTAGETYVPTKLDMTLQLYPMQTRQQQSREFSLRNFANGNLVRGGYW